MLLLVTGAGGFVGGAVVRHARAQGIPVRAMLRPGGRPATTLGVDSVEADLSSESELAGALRDCTAVIHLAAARTAKGTRPSVYRDVNVEGTGRLLRAAQEACVSRFVLGSTLGVHGFVTTGSVDESMPARPNTAYRQSKWLAERLVATPDGAGRMTRTIARLVTVVGAEGRNLDAFLEAVNRDHLRLLGDGGNRVDLIASEDAADGLVRCATMPAAAGQVYLLGGECWSVARLAARIAEELGRPPVRPGPPGWPYRWAIRLDSLRLEVTGRHAHWAYEREMLVADKFASIAKAARELGYAPAHSVDQAIRGLVAPFRARRTAGGATR